MKTNLSEINLNYFVLKYLGHVVHKTYKCVYVYLQYIYIKHIITL